MLPDKVIQLTGKFGDVVIMQVEEGSIRRYAEAVDDQNPLYWDQDYAKNSWYGSMIAPPGYFGWPIKKAVDIYINEELVLALSEAGYKHFLNGEEEFEFFYPVRAGDTLTALSGITSITEKDGKSGKMVFVITETTYTNQNGNLVARICRTSIVR